jgi:murein DD-endopeptidase MepM/ murein hydrolase activator NlpD
LVLRKDTNADFGINPRKGDRLVKAVDIVAAKQTFRAPSAIHAGDKEVMKIHSFTRVATTLVHSNLGYADDIPPFNPLKLIADARAPAETAPEPVQDDPEIFWSTRELAVDQVSDAIILSEDEVRDQVAEQAKTMPRAGSKPIALPPQLLLMRTSRASLPGVLAYANPAEPISTAPFSSIEVRMVPENVTDVPRSPQEPRTTQMDERLAVVRHGETVDDVLRAAGLEKAQIEPIIAAFGLKRGEAAVREGRRLKLLFADLDGSGTNMTLVRLSVYDDETPETIIAINDAGSYMRVTPPRRSARWSPRDDDEGGLQLYESLYETALKQEIPRPIVDELIRIFANDVDLQRPVSGGDSFQAFYAESEEAEGRGQLLHATITTRDETFHYYRYVTPDDGMVDYYDQNGRSTRKFLVRMPIAAGRLTSGFGTRFHPILGYSRPHTGVDWAAPMGTQIVAAGNGTIIKARWDSGYGRRIEVQHVNGYVTTYNHLSGFARGIKEGAKVRQGQVIGYLGQTGLATGPHLHYEIMVNGHFVDPLRVKLARTRELDGRMLAGFKRERDRIDSLLAKAPAADRVVTAQSGR